MDQKNTYSKGNKNVNKGAENSYDDKNIETTSKEAIKNAGGPPPPSSVHYKK